MSHSLDIHLILVFLVDHAYTLVVNNAWCSCSLMSVLPEVFQAIKVLVTVLIYLHGSTHWRLRQAPHTFMFTSYFKSHTNLAEVSFATMLCKGWFFRSHSQVFPHYVRHGIPCISLSLLNLCHTLQPKVTVMVHNLSSGPANSGRYLDWLIKARH